MYSYLLGLMKKFLLTVWEPHCKNFFPSQHPFIFLSHHLCTACRGWSSHSSPTHVHSHSGRRDLMRRSNPNSSLSVSLCSGSAPPPTGLQSQPQSPPQPPFPPEGTQTFLDDRKQFDRQNSDFRLLLRFRKKKNICTTSST